MIKLDLYASTLACDGTLIGDNLTYLGVGTDTRSDLAGKLFIALKGERFDAHEFIDSARENGVVALLVSRQVESDLPQIIVADTRIALGRLAAYWRQQLRLKVVGLTGSVGKTTVKEMIASILRTRAPTLATKGNLNNDIGVPLTLFELSAMHQYAVIEMGANHQHEIGYCTDIVQPDVALITKIAPAHIEGFGSIEGVAHAKSEIFSHSSKQCIAVLNAEINYKKIVENAIGDRRCLRFGLHALDNDVRASHVKLNEQGNAEFKLHAFEQSVEVNLSLPGEHNVSNALAAAAVALGLGFELHEIAAGLAKTPSTKGRVNQLLALNGALVIDDTYNANLSSVCAAIDLLVSKSRVTVAVLGDMGELGELADEMHAEVGAYAKLKGVSFMRTVGTLSKKTSVAFGKEAKHYDDIDSLIKALRAEFTGTEAILVKGSRSARMERVVSALCEPAQSQKEQDKELGGAH